MVCEGTCGGVGHEEPTFNCNGKPVPKFKDEKELRANKIKETKRYLDILALMQEEIDQVHSELEPLMRLLEDRLSLNSLGGNTVPPAAGVTQAHWDVMFEHEKLEKMMTPDEIRIDGPAIQLATNYKTYIRKDRARLEEQLIAVQQGKWLPTKEAWAHRSRESGYMETEVEGAADMQMELKHGTSTACLYESFLSA